MPKVLIVYASLTGNTESAAEFIASCFRSMEVDVEIKECQQVNASAFLEKDICVVGAYTYGSEGNLPDEIYDFYDELAELNLMGKVYGTFGTGEEDYGYFCKAADDFSEQFEKTGAKKGAEIIKIEEAPDIADKKRLADFVNTLFKSWKSLNS